SQDVELALDAAHNALESWSTTSAVERSNILLRIADRIEKCLRGVSGGKIFTLNESFFCNTYFLSWM
ncbi:hypothetical protein B2J67_04310, partial [Vibrio cholerae]